jgi:uncharacterized protein with von Willebrand factor type A (vWA) domain
LPVHEHIPIDVVGFARALRAAGLPLGVDQSARCAEAMRAALVYRQIDLAVFDATFEEWFGEPAAPGPEPTPMPRAPRHDAMNRSMLVSYTAEKVNPNAIEVEVPDSRKAASAVEMHHLTDFSACSDEERRALARAMRDLRLDVARRTSRRLKASRHGSRLDLARVVRLAARVGGVPIALAYRKPKIKTRPLVVLADISGSMELYTRLFLQFLHGVSHHHRPTEVFTFGTQLTRITGELELRDADRALDMAARQIVDYGGGTRIADSLHEFNRRYARQVVRAGAVVLIISDGWETGDPSDLGREVEKIHARAHRLVWLNPLLGRETYKPLVRGMAAALAHVDDFLPIHNLQALHQLADHLGRLTRRKGAFAPRHPS